MHWIGRALVSLLHVTSRTKGLFFCGFAARMIAEPHSIQPALHCLWFLGPFLKYTFIPSFFRAKQIHRFCATYLVICLSQYLSCSVRAHETSESDTIIR